MGMCTFLKGRISLITHGKYSGQFTFILNYYKKNNNIKNYTHLLVCGFKKTNSMTKIKKLFKDKKIFFKSKLFIKLINLKHTIITKYTVPRCLYEINIPYFTKDKITISFAMQKMINSIRNNIKKVNKNAISLLLAK